MIKLLTISNQHSKHSGEPPRFTNEDPNVYIGYFANRYGEQWVFVYDRNKGAGTLCGGDVGWDKPLTVENGTVDVMLNNSEKLWLAACWQEARRRLDDSPTHTFCDVCD